MGTALLLTSGGHHWRGPTPPLLLPSGGHHWRPVQTCSLEALPPRIQSISATAKLHLSNTLKSMGSHLLQTRIIFTVKSYFNSAQIKIRKLVSRLTLILRRRNRTVGTEPWRRACPSPCHRSCPTPRPQPPPPARNYHPHPPV